MFTAQLSFLYSCIVQGHKPGSNAGSPHISEGSHDTPAQTCTQGTPSSRQSLAETLFPGHSACAKLTVEAGHAKSLFAAGNKKELSNSGTVIPSPFPCSQDHLLSNRANSVCQPSFPTYLSCEPLISPTEAYKELPGGLTLETEFA